MAQVVMLEEAKLQTLKVEIQTLTLSGKQMTLSTFRQLPEAHIWLDNYRLAGEPWGIVRYFWGDYSEGKGVHVVWQAGGSLYRCFLSPLQHVPCPELDEVRPLATAADKAESKARVARVDAEEASRLSKWLHGVGKPSDHEEKARWAEACTMAEEIAVKQWREAATRLSERMAREFERLASLPQLFIAV